MLEAVAPCLQQRAPPPGRILEEEVPVDFAMLAVIALAGLVGPILAYPQGWHVPVVIGELLVGIILGRTGVGYLKASDPTFSFFAEVGFGLVMFVAGTHVPIRDPSLQESLGRVTARAVLVGAGSAVLGVLLASTFGTGHAALYAVLMASSSAALILPIIDSLELHGDHVLHLLPQVAIADAACIVALPLAIDPGHVGRAGLGALTIILGGVVLFGALSFLERKGYRHRLHHVSEERHFALELRISLMILFSLAAVAGRSHVSVMLAGFVFGLAVGGVRPAVAPTTHSADSAGPACPAGDHRLGVRDQLGQRLGRRRQRGRLRPRGRLSAGHPGNHRCDQLRALHRVRLGWLPARGHRGLVLRRHSGQRGQLGLLALPARNTGTPLTAPWTEADRGAQPQLRCEPAATCLVLPGRRRVLRLGARAVTVGRDIHHRSRVAEAAHRRLLCQHAVAAGGSTRLPAQRAD